MEICAVDWHLVLDYVKVLLSWPAVTLLLLSYVLCHFKVEISALIRRTKEADVFGQKVQFAQDQDVSSIPESPTSGGPKSAAFSRGASLGRASIAAPTPSDKAPTTLEQLAADPAAAAQAIQHWWGAAKYESVLNRIFGTQLRALFVLNAKDAEGETLANLSPFYTEHERLSTGAMQPPSPAPDYIAFLTSGAGFVRIEGTGDQSKFFITPLGKAFLQYVRENYRVIPPRAF